MYRLNKNWKKQLRQAKRTHFVSVANWCFWEPKVLLRAEGRSSKQVASIVKLCEISVNTWVKRYQNQGIEGLKAKPGRGPKAKLDKVGDKAAALAAVKANGCKRQKLTSKHQLAKMSGARPSTVF